MEMGVLGFFFQAVERVKLRSLFACFGFSHVSGSEGKGVRGWDVALVLETLNCAEGGGLGCRSFILVFVGWLGTVWNLGIRVSWGGNDGLGEGLRERLRERRSCTELLKFIPC